MATKMGPLMREDVKARLAAMAPYMFHMLLMLRDNLENNGDGELEVAQINEIVDAVMNDPNTDKAPEPEQS